MQRLRGINQYGVWKFVTPWMTTTRFEHCVGVYLLLKRLGADREEMVAGLLHDIGHAAFSHVYDYVVGRSEQQDSDGRMHSRMIENPGLKSIFKKNGIDIGRLIDMMNFPLLEKDLPDLCADRIDYVLRDSFMYGMTQKEEIPSLLSSIESQDNLVFFSDRSNARIMTMRFMQMDNEYWRSAFQNAIYALAGQAMRIALEKNAITNDDFFTTDNMLLKKLMDSGLPEVVHRLNMISPELRVEDNPDDYDFFVKGKCRFIDPLVSHNGGMKRLSEIDEGIRKSIEEFKRAHSRGAYIKILGGKNG
ncbi:HD domain-containing protein [Candidatus Woesearchaeota archaeon]|nr:HD domain-containing protein [Candidatus Woesearchaeota archaeon]